MRIPMVFFCVVILAACNDHKNETAVAKQVIEKDSTEFGAIQPFLEKNTPGEIIQRIDRVCGGIVYYITNKGQRKQLSDYKISPSAIKCKGKQGQYGKVNTFINDDGSIRVWAQDSNYSLIINSATADSKGK